MNQSSKFHSYSITTYLALSVFMLFCIEDILMGPGDWSTPFGFNARKILFLLSISLIVISYIINSKVALREALLFFFGYIFFCIFGLIIPTIYNIDLDISWADFKPLSGFLFIPFIASLYKETGWWKNHRKIISFLLLLIASLHVLIWIMGSISTDLGGLALSTMQKLYEPTIDPIYTTINAVNYTPSGRFRVQWGSSCFLILGLYFGFSQIQTKRTIKNYIYLLIMFLAICATQSRGMIAALFVGLINYIVFYYIIPLKLLNFYHYLTALFITIFISLAILPFFSPDFLTSIGAARVGTVSDSDRYLQIAPLAQNWLNHLLWGSGFGSNVEIIRSIQAPYSYEVSILALFMKIGIIGVLFSLLLISAVLHNLLNGDVYPYQKKSLVIIFSMVLTYIIASSTNPYLSNFFGTLVFYCFALELMFLNKPLQSDKYYNI